ncbi:MAG: ATP-binding protein [Microscillaceae bacterium]|nr:ATP-binding protein [Microscillaceae bacterium]MDW8461202.1 ATP-binding protein [Cytophagales bacterium]
MKIKNQIFFASWIVWSIIALMAYLFYSIPQTSEISLQQYEKIKKQVYHEMQIVEYDWSQINKSLNQLPLRPFEQINYKTKYPFFIFEEKKLIYWSDNGFVPEYTELEGNYRFRLLNLRQNLFISFKAQLDILPNKAEIYSLIPVYRQYKIENQYLKPHYNSDILPYPNIIISEINKPENPFKVTALSGEFLFCLKPTKHININYFLWYAFIVSACFSLLSLGLLVHFGIINNLPYAKTLGLPYIFWLIYLGLLYGALWYFHWADTHQLLVGATTWGLLVVVYWLNYYRNFAFVRWVLHSPQNVQYAIGTGLLAGVYLLEYAYFNILSQIFIHQQVSLDFTKSIDFDAIRLLYVLLLIGISYTFALLVHTFLRLIIQFFDNYSNFLYALFIAILAYSLFIFGTQQYIHFYSALFVSIFILVTYFWRLPKFLYSFKYLSTIYFFVLAILYAFLSSLVVFSTEEIKTIASKRKFAIQLLGEADAVLESRLKDLVTQIQRDSILPTLFRDSTLQKNIIENRLSNLYFKRNFENYQITTLLFNKQGRLIDSPQDSTLNYATYRNRYAKSYYQTDVPQVYFIDNLTGNLQRQYVVFIEVSNPKKQKVGALVLDFTQKKSIPNNVYPTLLVDKKFVQPVAIRSYSYAIFSGNKLNYSAGECNYETQFDTLLFNKPEIFEKGVSFRDFNHFALVGGMKKRVVVSSPYYTFQAIFTNFSFLFLILVFAIALLLLGSAAIHKFKGIKVNFATRIQFYLNLAFFLPLIIVSITTLNVISNTYQKDFEEQFVQKTESVTNNIAWHYENYKNGVMRSDKFSEIFSQVAQYVEADMNIFDERGILVISSQSAIYENNGLLSRYINPWAYKAIILEKKKNILLAEQVGLLNFKSVYVPIKSYQKGTIEGVLSIPFFDSKFQLETKKRESLAIIVNIFTSIFLIFLAISYFASQILTVPLRLITQRIRKTTFSEYNQPLEWNSNDEIGLFVEEFNKMLKKLDASREALERVQMENAWREIAQQVAHEIKNPLTPIKLTIQHMQMRLQNQPEKIQAFFERSFETLLTQVDVLDDIATSFSSFARMPVPESERFELAAVLREVENLYANDDKIKLSLQIPAGNFYVINDRKLMLRIFTNLVKNAIEAIPEDREPQIKLILETVAQKRVVVKVVDNGTGIPKDLRNKIFLPNFSTKNTGSGIGLAISKRGIEHAGGRIWFETEDNVGTTFFVELPLVD